MNQDESALASLGYRQEFKRDISPFQLVALSFSIVGVVQSIAAILFYSIPYGGPVAMVWGWVVGSFFLVCIALCIAELGSSSPTSAGLYYWTFKYSPPRCRKFMSWFIGYMNTIGYMSGVAGVEYSAAVQIATAAVIGTEGSYLPAPAHIFGIFCALMVTHIGLASLATKTIARLQSIYVFLNIALFVALAVILPVLTPNALRNNASYVFTNFENVSSWNNGFSFFLSLLAPVWTFGGFDSSVHVCEEARNAKTAVPFAVIASTILGCVFGFATNILLAFHMGNDLIAVINDPIGQPMATIMFNAVGKTGTVVLWSFIILTLYMSVTNLLIVSSRQIFAFSRDGALPFSSFIYHINPVTLTPVRAVLCSALVATLMVLLSFAGSAAVGAVFTMGLVSLYICYATPIIARYVGGQEFVPGPFALGKYGYFVAPCAVAFMLFMIIVLLFPTEPMPKAATMNYSIVVVGGTVLLSSMYYVISGHKWFRGPVVTLDESDEDRRTGQTENKERSRQEQA